MEAADQEKILSVINEQFDGEIIESGMVRDFFTIVLKKEKIVEIIRHLYHHAETEFQFLTTLCGIHFPDQNQMAVMYQLHNLKTNKRVRLKIFMPDDKPEVNTLTTVFPAANWMERETFDFFGIIFSGHPNLKRILNVEEMTIHPLRKEYPLEDQSREDKKDFMFGR
ncbi:MAG: NADH-ubiquinone oxidoreductase chain C [Cytophagales bacterium]|jgi:NADH-quinone oxidoreductase subunit C|nr:NADH-quinone oxidoreductase subunit C [Bacteroidota bacterium]MBS1981612.1 NADH-quinone oxidoreductase subunit C [Bacteroidota bacterium]WHZ08920.1 MAG: NADH-ubiquinone oxidoreductase chain C [Cytophagales bacterium]